LIEQGLYFVVHAPRQSGKTTTMRTLARALSEDNQRVVLAVSCERAEAAGEDFGAANDEILSAIGNAAQLRRLPPKLMPPTPAPGVSPGSRLHQALSEWALQCPVPIALLFDEIDSLQGASLISVLRQLRDGFQSRPDGFPASVVVCGMRDVRDYKAASGGNPDRLGSASPFNVAVDSFRIGDFTFDEVAQLYAQHTADTGQAFTEAAVEQVYCYTAGQPWLVNAIAREIIVTMQVTGDVAAAHVDQAKERLIAARATHLDSLTARLEEPRVRRIIEPLVAGRLTALDPEYNDDVAYVRDLGLVGQGRPLAIANPIYREVITRVLSQSTADAVLDRPRSFVLPDGRLDMGRLLREFVAFWRKNGEILASRKGYNEAGAQLVLLGFLYRIVNGGGLVDTEYGVGWHRIDILVRKPYTAADGTEAMQQEVLELKVRYHGEADPLAEGLEQLDDYLTRMGLDTGTLVIFDRRRNAPPVQERGEFFDESTPSGRTVTLLRL
jgi:hypothetical protein